MKKMVISVIVFMVLVMGITFLLINLYTPMEASAAFDGSGYYLSLNGEAAPCHVRLGGTLSSYRFELRAPSFFSNPLYDNQGLIVDDYRLIGKFVVGWPEKDSNYVTFTTNGTRFYTDRNLDFVVAILPSRLAEDTIAIAPAQSEEEALALLKTLTESEQFRQKSPSTCDRLLEYLK